MKTSIKAILQQIQSNEAEILQGTVISAEPLRIQMANDEKLIINERITVVPRHLSDYTAAIDITLDSGEIYSTTTADGAHTHNASGTTKDAGSHSHTFSGNTSTIEDHTHDYSGVTQLDDNYSGTTAESGGHRHTYSGTVISDGDHAHEYTAVTDENAAHTHALDTFNIYQATATIYNALKEGDEVYVLSINNGKLYYILDKVVD